MTGMVANVNDVAKKEMLNMTGTDAYANIVVKVGMSHMTGTDVYANIAERIGIIGNTNPLVKNPFSFIIIHQLFRS
jgi:hypothetical protein